MSTFLERLERMSSRESVVQITRKKVNGDQQLFCPVQLKKDEYYTISASYNGRTPISSAIFNGDERPECEARSALKNTLTFVPKKDGDYVVAVVPERSDLTKEGKVTVTVKKRHVPFRARLWL